MSIFVLQFFFQTCETLYLNQCSNETKKPWPKKICFARELE